MAYSEVNLDNVLLSQDDANSSSGNLKDRAVEKRGKPFFALFCYCHWTGSYCLSLDIPVSNFIADIFVRSANVPITGSDNRHLVLLAVPAQKRGARHLVCECGLVSRK